jgi:hypothetical protein
MRRVKVTHFASHPSRPALPFHCNFSSFCPAAGLGLRGRHDNFTAQHCKVSADDGFYSRVTLPAGSE